MIRLLGYAKGHTGWLALAFVIILTVVGLELYQPVIIGMAVDDFITVAAGTGQGGMQVVWLGLMYLMTVAAACTLNYCQAMILAKTGQKIIYNIRMDVFEHICTLSLKFFNNNPIGRLVTRVTNDTETLNEMYTSVIVNIFKSVFILLGVIATMLSYNVRLSLMTFAVIPFIVVFTFVYRKFSRRIYRNIRGRISALNAFISEHLSGMKIVQVFAAEDKIFDKFKKENEDLKKAHMGQIKAFSVYSPTSYLLNISALALLMWFGGSMVLEGTITIGTIVVFQRYIGKFFEPVQQLAEQFDIIQSAMAASERIFGIMDEVPDITDADDAVELAAVRGEIEFRNVWFAYDEGEWILKDVSFKVNPGEQAAFVGATGAGKTTIQNLICRYYDIQKGQILIDGIDIRHIKIRSLRQNIGQMLQDVFLFTGSIKSNIRLRNPQISDEEIISASRYVNADKFIQTLDNKYNERVIERGASFSSGQRQLISFARTLAFKPSILILDEATANIDTETEALIQDALTKLMEGRTTLIVAHRLSTIQSADKIMVMHKGEIKESGTHQELLSKKGLYYNLYRLQYEKSVSA